MPRISFEKYRVLSSNDKKRLKSYFNFNIVWNFMLQKHWNFHSFFHVGGQSERRNDIVCSRAKKWEEKEDSRRGGWRRCFSDGWKFTSYDRGKETKVYNSVATLCVYATISPLITTEEILWIYFQHIHPLSCSVACKSSLWRYAETNFWFTSSDPPFTALPASQFRIATARRMHIIRITLD